MKNKQNRVAVVVMSVVVLLALALGPVAPGVEPQVGAVDGLHGLWADPMAGSGSGT
jgi:hypothetical protein